MFARLRGGQAEDRAGGMEDGAAAAALRSELDAARRAIDATRERETALNAQLEMLRQEGQKREREGQARPGDAKQFQALKAQVEQLTGELARARGEHDQAQQAKTAAEARQAAQSRQVGELENQVRQFRGQLGAAQQERDTAAEQLKRALADLKGKDQSGGERLADLQQQLQQAQAQNRELKQQLERLKAGSSSASAEVGRLKHQLEQARSERAAAVAQIRELEQQVEQLQPEEDTLVTARPTRPPDQAEAESSRAAAEVSKLRQELAQARSENANASAQIQQLEEQRQLAQEQIRGLGDEVAALHEESRHPTMTGMQDPERALHDAQEELRRSQVELAQTNERLEAEAKRRAKLELDLGAAGRSGTDLRRQAQELQDRLAESKQKEQALETELADGRGLRNAFEEQRARLAALDGKVTRANELEEERFRLLEQLEELRQELKEFKGLEHVDDQRHDLALQVATLKQKETESEALREDKARLSEQVDQSRREIESLNAMISTFNTAKDDRSDLALKVELLTKQLEVVERLHTDNARLRATVAESQGLGEQVAALQADNAALRSKGLVVADAARPPLPESTESFGGLLRGILARISESSQSRDAVLADEAGLVVAGDSPLAEAMAAIAAMTIGIGRKARDLLPLGRIDQMNLVDQNSLTFATHPLEMSSARLILATLSVGPAPDSAAVDQVVRELSKSE